MSSGCEALWPLKIYYTAVHAHEHKLTCGAAGLWCAVKMALGWEPQQLHPCKRPGLCHDATTAEMTCCRLHAAHRVSKL